MGDIALVEGNNELNIALEPIPTVGFATFTGSAKDGYTGEYLSGVTVTLNGYQDVTGLNGAYRIEDVIPGDYTISFSHPDYYPKSFGTSAKPRTTHRINGILMPIA